MLVKLGNVAERSPSAAIFISRDGGKTLLATQPERSDKMLSEEAGLGQR